MAHQLQPVPTMHNMPHCKKWITIEVLKAVLYILDLNMHAAGAGCLPLVADWKILSGKLAMCKS
jgi:hypothetical protein